jgi:hypothetical protein
MHRDRGPGAGDPGDRGSGGRIGWVSVIVLIGFLRAVV